MNIKINSLMALLIIAVISATAGGVIIWQSKKIPLASPATEKTPQHPNPPAANNDYSYWDYRNYLGWRTIPVSNFLIDLPTRQKEDTGKIEMTQTTDAIPDSFSFTVKEGTKNIEKKFNYLGLIRHVDYIGNGVTGTTEIITIYKTARPANLNLKEWLENLIKLNVSGLDLSDQPASKEEKESAINEALSTIKKIPDSYGSDIYNFTLATVSGPVLNSWIYADTQNIYYFTAGNSSYSSPLVRGVGKNDVWDHVMGTLRKVAFNRRALQDAAFNAVNQKTNGKWDKKIEITSLKQSLKAATGIWWAKDAWDWLAWQQDDGEWAVLVSLDGFDCNELKKVPSQYATFFHDRIYRDWSPDEKYCYDHSR